MALVHSASQQSLRDEEQVRLGRSPELVEGSFGYPVCGLFDKAAKGCYIVDTLE